LRQARDGRQVRRDGCGLTRAGRSPCGYPRERFARIFAVLVSRRESDIRRNRVMPIAFAGALLCASHSVGAAAPRAEESGANPPSVNELFKKWGAAYGVEWQLLEAVAKKESRLNPNAVNNADNESIGLMQVLCRPDGRGGCANTLKVEGWSGATRRKLFDPDFNIKIGAQILAWNIREYGMPKAIAVYNRWAERASPVAGPFENQRYVAAVLGNYRYRESARSTLFLSNGPSWFLGPLGGASCSDSGSLHKGMRI